MNISFFGDSHTAGAELDHPSTESYAAQLAQKLKASFVNHSVNGASNTKIIRTVERQLATWKQTSSFPDLVIVGWTDFDRQDWYVEHDYHTIYSPQIGNPDLLDNKRTQFYLEHIKDNVVYIQQMIKFYNNQFFNLHCELCDLSINHVFFNAVQSLGQYKTLCYHHDWAHQYLDPYNQLSAYVQWAEAQGFEHVTPGKYHYQKNVHGLWADVLLNHIKKHSLSKE